MKTCDVCDTKMFYDKDINDWRCVFCFLMKDD